MTVVHWLVLGYGIHDATERVLKPHYHILFVVRRVKGCAQQPTPAWQRMATTLKFQKRWSPC